jgi:CubicO group peptidase (beta-lactamase class C family)
MHRHVVSRLLLPILAVGLCSPRPSPAQARARAAMPAAIDSIALEPVTARRAAGASVAVLRGADTILIRGYGKADLELDAPTPDGAVYEIGSVTKQFTAAAVFQLRDRGRLALDDEITKYLPDYPTQGQHVTIRRLLNHTSGIKGYTEMPVFWSTMAPRELPRDSLVALFGKQPFDFAPGDLMIYNNSAYFLLGLIIEKASGEKYEDYVQKHLFQPAGMTSSRYCSNYDVVKHRAHGYDYSPNGGLTRAKYLAHIWPYAAGSLCSTARDLVTWNHALHGTHGQGGTILSSTTYREYLTPGTLNDGTRLRYANGLSLTESGGRRRISHGGGIFGFLSELRYLPDEDLSIAVLVNTSGPADPSGIADQIEDVVLGQAPASPARAFADDLASLTGSYAGPGRGQQLTVTVSADSGALTLKMGNNGRAQRLSYVDGLTFGNGVMRYQFIKQADRVVELRADQVGGYYVLKRVEK